MRFTTLLLAASAAAAPADPSSTTPPDPSQTSLVDYIKKMKPCELSCMPWAAAWAGCSTDSDIECMNNHQSYLQATNLDACEAAECGPDPLGISFLLLHFLQRISNPSCTKDEIAQADKLLADGIAANPAKNYTGEKTKDPKPNTSVSDIMGGANGGGSGSTKKDEKSGAVRGATYTGVLALALVPLFL